MKWRLIGAAAQSFSQYIYITAIIGIIYSSFILEHDGTAKS